MIFIPTGPTTATVIENRQAIAEDAPLCYSGALIYEVNTVKFTGQGPIRVIPAHDNAGVDENRCRPLARAPVGPGESFHDPTSRMTLTVTAAPDGALGVQLAAATP
jgi:hypothetical protein